MKRWLGFHDAAVEVHRRKLDISKEAFARTLVERFGLKKKGKAWYADDFAVSFAYSKGRGFSNTVVSLAKIKLFDDRPFLVCLLRPTGVETFLANSSLVKKVSHSSQKLSLTNIKGSINGSDIFREMDGLRNVPTNFESLYEQHANLAWEDNLERIVEATTAITPTGKRFEVTAENTKSLLCAPERSRAAERSGRVSEVERVLQRRLRERESEVLLAAETDNLKLRGDAVEYVMTGEGAVHGLGDAVFEETGSLRVVVDVKTKVLGLSSNPKLYNVDKALKELAENQSAFCIFFIGIDRGARRVAGRLVDILDTELIGMTCVQFHWAGRNSRGVTQLAGDSQKFFERDFARAVDCQAAKQFLTKLLAG